MKHVAACVLWLARAEFRLPIVLVKIGYAAHRFFVRRSVEGEFVAK